MQRISDEYAAGLAALSGPTQGTARHQCITARMEHVASCSQALQSLVGPEQGIAFTMAAMDATPEVQG